MSDLRQRVPGHALIDKLLHQWDVGNIRLGPTPGQVVIDDEAKGWYLGVKGERRVAQLLEGLGESWTVLHSVPAGSKGRDIDHLIVGPSGVFTVNTKYSPGKEVWCAGRGLLVGGVSQAKYLRAAMSEIRQAEVALSHASGLTVPVSGLIVFVAPGRLTRKASVGDPDVDLRVLRDAELLSTIQSRRIFSDDQVRQIAEAACNPKTWLRNPGPSTIGHQIAREYEALEQALEPAVRGFGRHAPRAQVAPARAAAHARTATGGARLRHTVAGGARGPGSTN